MDSRRTGRGLDCQRKTGGGPLGGEVEEQIIKTPGKVRQREEGKKKKNSDERDVYPRRRHVAVCLGPGPRF